MTLARREDLAGLLAAARGDERPRPPEAGVLAEVAEALAGRGALFLADLCQETGRLPVEIAEGLWDGVARGLLTADGFGAVRSLLAGRYRAPRTAERRNGLGGRPGGRFGARLGRPRPLVAPALSGGRWALLDQPELSAFEPDALAEAIAGQLLRRWGVVFYELAAREVGALGWRAVLWALRRLEARGLVRGGRFVAGFGGEQFALPEAAERLGELSRAEPAGAVVRIAATDPLNLTGIVLPGPRVPAVRGRELTLADGVPVDGEPESLRHGGHLGHLASGGTRHRPGGPHR